MSLEPYYNTYNVVNPSPRITHELAKCNPEPRVEANQPTHPRRPQREAATDYNSSYSTSHILYACPTHFILLDFIVLISGEE
jgi:hypothetical protein